jgi:hypothetical protein
MYALRRWPVRHARGLNVFYRGFEAGVSGIHLMAYRQEHSIPEIIDRSGVLRGRVPWYPGRSTEPTSNRTFS